LHVVHYTASSDSVHQIYDYKAYKGSNQPDYNSLNNKGPSDEPVGSSYVFHYVDFSSSGKHCKFNSVGNYNTAMADSII